MSIINLPLLIFAAFPIVLHIIVCEHLSLYKKGVFMNFNYQ